MNTNRLPVLAALLASISAFGADVDASIEGVASAKGHVVCGLFGSATGFPTDTTRTIKLVRVPASPPAVHCTFAGLPAGRYAIAVFHDENDDGVLDTNFLGLPREGYGASNNHVHATHAPGFDESSFAVDAAPVDLRIRLTY